MPSHDRDIPDWDTTFTARWQAALKREFGSGTVAAHRLSKAGINPTTVKSWIKRGGRPTVANLCLVARAADDPSAFIVDVCGDEPWARELGVALQRRRLDAAELAMAYSDSALARDPFEVIRALAGPRRRFRYVTDDGVMTAPLACPEEGARHMLGLQVTETSAIESVLRDMGWILVEEGEDQPLIIHCYGIMVSDRACATLRAWLDQILLRQGALVRVFITDWVALPCANLYQLQGEIERIREMRRASEDRRVSSVGEAPAPSRPGAERRSLSEAPVDGAVFRGIWEQTGGILDDALMHTLTDAGLFDMSAVYGVQDNQFRVRFVGTNLRLPEGLTRERVTGHDVLEIQAARGYGAMIAAHFALAAHERMPVVHHVRVNAVRSYRRISFPVFDYRGRRVVAVIGFSDARQANGSGSSSSNA